MYCPNCGASINKHAEICVHCGVNVHKFSHQTVASAQDQPMVLVNALSLCCFPLLGIVMYFVWKDKQPKAAKSALIFGLVGLVFSMLISVMFFIMGIGAEMINNNDYPY